MVSIVNKKNNKAYLVCPYALVSSKEEPFTYLLCASSKRSSYVLSLCLCRVKSVRETLEGVQMKHPLAVEKLEKIIKYGPQYNYEGKQKTVHSRLTKRGVVFFSTFYVLRPISDKIEGLGYYSNCSNEQVLQYFTCFEKKPPFFLRQKLILFYYRTLKNYKNEKSIADHFKLCFLNLSWFFF